MQEVLRGFGLKILIKSKKWRTFIMSENKEFYVIIQGKKVFVSEEVYREYVRPIRAIQRQQRRAWECRIVGRKGNFFCFLKNFFQKSLNQMGEIQY